MGRRAFGLFGRQYRGDVFTTYGGQGTRPQHGVLPPTDRIELAVAALLLAPGLAGVALKGFSEL